MGGTSSVEVFSIAGQRSSYENANLVVGGGVALCGVEGIGTYAQSGATKVVIHTGARLTSGSSSGANIIGGGYALSSNTNTDVMGGTSIIVEDDTALPKKVIGGGVVFSASNAGGFTQEGTASACVDKAAISIGERCTISQYVIGGGYIGRNTKTLQPTRETRAPPLVRAQRSPAISSAAAWLNRARTTKRTSSISTRPSRTTSPSPIASLAETISTMPREPRQTLPAT